MIDSQQRISLAEISHKALSGGWALRRARMISFDSVLYYSAGSPPPLVTWCVYNRIYETQPFERTLKERREKEKEENLNCRKLLPSRLHSPQMTLCEDKTFFLYGIGKSPDVLCLGNLVLNDYANPTAGRHYTHKPLRLFSRGKAFHDCVSYWLINPVMTS